MLLNMLVWRSWPSVSRENDSCQGRVDRRNNAGMTTLLGSDDLLAAFACGTAFAWE